MQLIKELTENEFEEIEGKIYFKYLQKDILIRFEKEIPINYVHKNIEYLNSIKNSLMIDLCNYSIKFCKTIMNDYPNVEYKFELNNIKKPLDILNYMNIICLKVDMYQDKTIPVLNLSGSCQWDK